MDIREVNRLKKTVCAAVAVMILMLASAGAAFSQLPGAKAANSGLIPGMEIGSLKAEKDGGGQIDLGKYGKPYVAGFFVVGSNEIASQLMAASKVLSKKEYAGVDLIALTYATDAKGKKDARDFLKSKKIDAVLVFDTKLAVAKRFGADSFPAFYMVDKNGLIRSLKITDIGKKIRKRTFEDFVKMLAKGEQAPMVDFLPMDDYPKAQMGLVGKPAPDFTLSDLDGRKYSLSKYKGKNVILVFFSPTCPHCLLELPRVQDFYMNNKARYNLEVIALTSAGGKEMEKRIRQIISDKVLTFPVLVDLKGSAFDNYGVKPVPVAFFVNKEGTVKDVLVGEVQFFALVYHSIFRDPLRLGS